MSTEIAIAQGSEPEIPLLTDESERRLNCVRELRDRYVASEVFQRPIYTDLAIDPKTVKCPEDTIGAENISGTDYFIMRTSTIELGAICGIDEQSLTLRSIIANIRAGKPRQHTVVSPLIRHAGFNNGDLIPAITVEAVVGPDGIQTSDIFRSLIQAKLSYLNPVNKVRRSPDFRTCLQAAKLYVKSKRKEYICLPPLKRSQEKSEPADVVAVYAHLGNTTINNLLQEASLPAIVDTGVERDKRKRRKYYRAMYDVVDTSRMRAPHMTPCQSFTTWVNQTILSHYLEYGRPPISNQDVRVLAGWVNQQSRTDRMKSVSTG